MTDNMTEQNKDQWGAWAVFNKSTGIEPFWHTISPVKDSATMHFLAKQGLRFRSWTHAEANGYTCEQIIITKKERDE